MISEAWFYLNRHLSIGCRPLMTASCCLTLFQPRGGGGRIHPPPGFSLAITTKINRSTPNFLTFNFYYRYIIWPKIRYITCQGVTWSLFCRKHFVSPHIFHCIFTEFSCSTFSFFWHLYLVLISVFWWKKHTFGYLFTKTLKFNKNFDDVSTFEKIRNFD